MAAMTQQTRRTRRWRSARGAELVELAVSLPVLLMLIVGIVDFGFLFQTWEVLTNAAREGARIGVLPGYSAADVQARVSAYTSAGGLTGTPTTTMSISTSTTPGGTSYSTVQVNVAYTYNFLFLRPIMVLFGRSFQQNLVLNANSVMRTEVLASGS
jgi:Flp pilus assembly protein TadG